MVSIELTNENTFHAVFFLGLNGLSFHPFLVYLKSITLCVSIWISHMNIFIYIFCIWFNHIDLLSHTIKSFILVFTLSTFFFRTVREFEWGWRFHFWNTVATLRKLPSLITPADVVMHMNWALCSKCFLHVDSYILFVFAAVFDFVVTRTASVLLQMVCC